MATVSKQNAYVLDPTSMQIIRVHADAPLKPALAQTCNGCGICCLAEPCPVGVLVSLRTSGPCRALRWDDAAKRYRCGLLGPAASSFAPWTRLARRLIAAGSGCDSDAEVG